MQTKILGMAKNTKFARELKGPGNLDLQSFREQQSKPATLYLLELRTRHSEAQSQLPRRKLVVTIGHQDGNSNLPRVIKIKQV